MCQPPGDVGELAGSAAQDGVAGSTAQDGVAILLQSVGSACFLPQRATVDGCIVQRIEAKTKAYQSKADSANIATVTQHHIYVRMCVCVCVHPGLPVVCV